MDNQSPFNALPPVVVALCLVMAGAELVFQAGASGLIGDARAIGWRLEAFGQFAFPPAIVDFIWTRGSANFDYLKRFVTYTFVHLNFTDAMFGIALLLALGKFVGDVFGNIATLIVFLVSAIFGAFIYGLIIGDGVALIGAYPPVYGLIGAYTFVIWMRLGQTGESQLAAFRLIGFLLGLQLFYGVVFGASPRWIAELAGFVAGFGIAPLLAPGGWQAFLGRLRDR